MPGLSLEDRVSGALIGAAVGDAFGAPMECVPARDNLRIFGRAMRFEDVTAAMIAEAGHAIGASWCTIDTWGQVTDDTVLCDLLLDAILRHDGDITAHTFAEEWPRLVNPLPDGRGGSMVRLGRLHWLAHISFLRQRLHDVPRRELGHGEADSTDAIMCAAPIGLLFAGDPLGAELAAVDVTAVHQQGRPRDIAGGYCAALAACFLPEATVETVVATGVRHVRDERSRAEVAAIVELGRRCASCGEFVDRYWSELVGRLVPAQDWQHHGTDLQITWNASEVLGVALALLLVTQGGQEPREMLRYAALNGRDADTACRVAGSLLGAWRGLDAVPADWRSFVLARNPWLDLEPKSRRLARLARERLQRLRGVAAGILAEENARA